MSYTSPPQWQAALSEYVATANANMFFPRLAQYEVDHVVQEATKLLYGTDYPRPALSGGDDNSVVMTWTAGGETVQLQLGEILVNLLITGDTDDDIVGDPKPSQVRAALDELYPDLKVPTRFVPLDEAVRRIGCDRQWLGDAVRDGSVGGRVDGEQVMVMEDEVNSLVSELYGVPSMPCPYCTAPGAACGSTNADDRTPICRWIEKNVNQAATA